GFVPVMASVPMVKALSVSGLVTVIVFTCEVVTGTVTGTVAPKSTERGATSMPNFLPVRLLSAVAVALFPIGSVTEKRLARPAGAPVKEAGTLAALPRKPGAVAGSWRKVLMGLPPKSVGKMLPASAVVKSGG